jgi:hypothetical protein
VTPATLLTVAAVGQVIDSVVAANAAAEAAADAAAADAADVGVADMVEVGVADVVEVGAGDAVDVGVADADAADVAAPDAVGAAADVVPDVGWVTPAAEVEEPLQPARARMPVARIAAARAELAEARWVMRVTERSGLSSVVDLPGSWQTGNSSVLARLRVGLVPQHPRKHLERHRGRCLHLHGRPRAGRSLL